MSYSAVTNNFAVDTAASVLLVNRALEISMERLSTGKRINAASDDVAGMAIASRLSTEIRGINQAVRNALDGQSLIDTAEGAHKEIESILQRMREISVQGANGTNSIVDRSNIRSELFMMTNEIERIAQSTSWAGKGLLSVANNIFNFQIGSQPTAANQVGISIQQATATVLGLFGLEPAEISAATNGNTVAAGNIFDVKNTSAQDMVITGVKQRFISNGSGDYKVSYREGSSVNTNPQSSGWILAGTATGITSGSAGATDVNFDSELEIRIGAGQTLGVWVSGTDSFNVKYNTGTAVGNTLASDTYLTIKEGYGTQVDSASVYSPRAWNGSFKYSYDMMEGVSLVDAAINEINTERSKLGAASLRFNYAINNMTNTSTNLSEAKGRIEDADLAKETTQLAKNNILNNIAIATLAQSNVHKGSIMGLLQG